MANSLQGFSEGIIVGQPSSGRCGPGTTAIPVFGDTYNRTVAVGLGTASNMGGLAYQYMASQTTTIASCDGSVFHFDGLQADDPAGWGYQAYLGPHTFTYPIDITMRYRVLSNANPPHSVFDYPEFKFILTDAINPANTTMYNEYVVFDLFAGSSTGSPSFTQNDLQIYQAYDSNYSGTRTYFPSGHQYQPTWSPGPGQYAPTFLKGQWANNLWRMVRCRFAPTTDFDTAQVGAGVHGEGVKVWQDGTSEPSGWTAYDAWTAGGTISVATNPIRYVGWWATGQFSNLDGPCAIDVDYFTLNSGWQ